MKTFKHSGDLGDIIMSLPTIRALGGGTLYLDSKGGKGSFLIKTDQGNKTKLNENSIKSITNLLECQSYITCVKFWNGEKIDYNLDEFRKHIKYNNLADSHLAAFDLPFKERDEKWLTVDNNFIKSIIISRSCRYQSNHSFWGDFLSDPNAIKNSIFIGHELEHKVFEYAFGKQIEYRETPTLLEAAKIIHASKLTVCNQSVIYTLAEAMKVNLILEVYKPYPACIFNRQGAQYV